MNIGCFMSLASTKNLSETSNLLNLNKPAVVQNIKRLEEDLGVNLFIPNDGEVVLSSAGRKMYQFFLDFESDMRKASVELSRRKSSSELKIVASEYVSCPEWFINAVNSFREQEPDADIQLYQASPANSLELLSSGSVDMMLSSRYLASNVRLAPRICVLGEIPLYLIVAKDSAYAATTMNDLKIAMGPHFAAYACEEDEAAVIFREDQEFVRGNMTPKRSVVLDNLDSVYLAVRMGSGVTVSPINNKLKNADVFHMKRVARTVTLCLTRIQVRTTPLAVRFEDYIQAYCASLEDEI
ncbi:MAG: LysR family transcriptional regulator [Oscillospiraceae bacterium]